MQLTNLANLNGPRVQCFQMNNGKFALVTYTIAREETDRVEVEVQAFEIDAGGNNVKVAVGRRTGQPSRTSGTTHVIPRSGNGDTHRLRPGWIRVPGEFTPMPGGIINGLPQGTPMLDALPATAELGDVVWLSTNGNGAAYRWVQGTLLDIMGGKVRELEQLIDQSGDMAELDL